MPVATDARHALNWSRPSNAAERSIGTVAASFPPDVLRRNHVSTTHRCIYTHRTHQSSDTARCRYKGDALVPRLKSFVIILFSVIIQQHSV